MSMYDDGYDEEAADLAASLGQDVVGRGGNQNFSSGGGNTFTDSSGNTTNFRPSTTAGLNQQQFENRFGITDRNPFGQTGFAKFFDRISKGLGGKGVDYRQQFRDIDRMHNLDPGTTQQRMMDRQYQLYREPKIADDGRITSGGIDRLGRGTFQGPVEEINREMGTGEQLTRAGIGALPVVGPMLSDVGGTDLYLSSRVTPEMRARENPSLAETFLGSVNSFKDSMASRLGSLASGKQPSSLPVQMDTSGARQPTADELVAATQAQAAAAPIAVEEANPQLPMLPAEFDPRLSDTTTADMLRDPSIATPTSRPDLPLPDTYARNFGMNPVKPEDTFTLEDLFPELRNASNVGMNPAKPEDTFTVQDIFPELRNAPNEGLMRFEDRPRNAPNEGLSRQDFLKLLAPEPELGPYEQSQAPTRDLRDSTALAGLDYPTISELMTLGADLMTGGGPRTSIPLGEGTLNFNLNRDNPGIEYRRQLQGKNLGIEELLNFLGNRTG